MDTHAAPSGASMRAVAVGDRAPDFVLPDGSGTPVRLSALLGTGPVVLYFYPGDFTPACVAEACAFRDSAEEFAAAGAAVVGVSGDPPGRHAWFAGKLRLPFRLLSDADGAVRALYGVPRTLGLMPGRVTYVIDGAGLVRMAFTSQLRPGAHVKRALAVVRELAAVAVPQPPSPP
jgi:peroxiredoxin Q/BCP